MRKKLLTMIVISILAIGNIGCVKEDINQSNKPNRNIYGDSNKYNCFMMEVIRKF